MSSELPDQLEIEPALQAGAAIVAEVRSNFPMRFYVGERTWRATVSVLLLTMADTVEHLVTEASTMCEIDALTLLRSVFERSVTVAWILVDPDVRWPMWREQSARSSRIIFEEIAAYGFEIAEPAMPRPGIDRLPKLEARTDDVDAYWAPRVDGLRAAGHHYSFRGLYTIIYRTGSQSAHGGLSSMNEYQDWSKRPVVVSRPTGPGDPMWAALATPVYAIALVIAATRFKWINPDRIRQTIPGNAGEEPAPI
jgi:Family of unknown function (DUF5677)